MQHIFRTVNELVKSILRPIITKHRYPHVVFGYNTHVSGKSSFGQHVKIYENCLLTNLEIQSYSYIGGSTKIANCKIGKFCSIAPEVRIGLGSHPVDRISTYPGFYSKHASGVKHFHTDESIDEHPSTTIGNDVWIGTRAIIPGGITIGDGAVIAAGSVVTKNVLPYTIMGGIPAKLIKKRFSDTEINKLLDFKWWDKDEKYLMKIGPSFMNPAQFFKIIDE